jgi:hypothetical protein
MQTKSLPLGACQCPGSPHAAGDEAVVKERYSYLDLVEIDATAASVGVALDLRNAPPGITTEEVAEIVVQRLGLMDRGKLTRQAQLRMFELGVVSWNMTNGTGGPVPLTEIGGDQGDRLAEELDQIHKASKLPNESGGRSPTGTSEESPATTSPTSPTPS